MELKERQEMYRKKFKRSYCTKHLEYICVDEMGELITPNYVTSAFPRILAKNNFRKIRFHDLRHTCASLLLANGVSMKQIQEWLGHTVHKNAQLIKIQGFGGCLELFIL